MFVFFMFMCTFKCPINKSSKLVPVTLTFWRERVEDEVEQMNHPMDSDATKIMTSNENDFIIRTEKMPTTKSFRNTIID